MDTCGDKVLKFFGWSNPYDDPAVPAIGTPVRHWREYIDIWGINANGTENRNDLYLRRYYIYRGKHIPHIYLHHIMRSDYERACHDHPWDFVSLILTGKYREHLAYPQPETATILMSSRTRRAGAIVAHRAEDFHRLELKKPMWTLVFSFKKRRVWGFLTPDKGWIQWNTLYQYIKDMME